jgi:hypothetical protein
MIAVDQTQPWNQNQTGQTAGYDPSAPVRQSQQAPPARNGLFGQNGFFKRLFGG